VASLIARHIRQSCCHLLISPLGQTRTSLRSDRTRRGFGRTPLPSPCPEQAVRDQPRLVPGSEGQVYAAFMAAFICTACGTQYAPSEAEPAACLICTDERQFVPASGQSWTTLERLRQAHSNKFRRLAMGLMTIETSPAFGIGQRAILTRTPAGNVLWDCLALIDDATVDPLTGLFRRRRDRPLPPPLLHHDGGVEPRARGRADPPARG